MHQATAPPEDGERVFLALGSNIEDRISYLRGACDALAAHDAAVILASSVYESAAHLKEGQDEAPDFLNAVIEVRPPIGPLALLDLVHTIERAHGRHRTTEKAWAPRTLDIDILSFGGRTITLDRLIVPHPRLAQRRFVLEPFAEIAADHILPEPIADTVGRLLARCPDALPLRRLHPPDVLLPSPR